MYTDDFDDDSNPTCARTTTVLVFLAAFAVMVSFLAVYAVPNALIAADIMRPWTMDSDPRPGLMLRWFVGLFTTFAIVGVMFRWASGRQLRRIDAMAEAEDERHPM